MLVAGGLFLNPITMAFGALLPDADHPKTLIGKFIPLHRWFHHRGFTHTVQFGLIVSGILWLLWGTNAAVGYAAGQLTHMLLDSCTPSGVYWFGRKKKKPRRA